MYRKLVAHMVFVMLFFVYSGGVNAQNNLMTGSVLEAGNKLPIPGVTIYICSLTDSLKSHGTISAQNGAFTIESGHGLQLLKVSFVGFQSFIDTINVKQANYQLPPILLVEDNQLLDEINIVSSVIPTYFKGDTTIYNPNAFKVNLDATANDLLLKMPGFYETEGKLLAMGDTIKEVLVDGKRFFGSNVKEALKAIRPEIIKTINVYDFKSTESEYSGFEDLNGGKTINIVTKRQKDVLLNGETYAGIGKENRYVVNTSINRFSEKTRLNFMSGTNSIEVPVRLNQGSARQTIAGNELDNKHIQYSHGSIGKHEVHVNYGYNDGQMDNYSANSQDYIAGALKGQSNNSDNLRVNNMRNHQLGLNYRNQSNEKYQLSFSGTMASGNNKGNSASNSKTYQNEDLINSNKRTNAQSHINERLNSRFNYNRKLSEKSAMSANASLRFSHGEGNSSIESQTTNSSHELVQEIDQTSISSNKNMFFSYGVSYNYKISSQSYLNVGYTYDLSQGDSKKQSFDYDVNDKSYSLLDSLTSSDFINSSSSHRGKIAFKTQHNKSNIYLGLNLSANYLESQENFPDQMGVNETFLFLEPQIKYQLRFKKMAHLQINYGMSSQNPSLYSLQSIVDNSNPLYISSGNPELNSSQTHQAMLSYAKTIPISGTFISVGVRGTLINDKVAQKRVIAQNDTIVLNSYFLPAGGQFSQAVNVDGHYSINMNGMFGFSLKKLKSKVNLQTNITYSESPNIINDVMSLSQSLNILNNINLTSNINEKIDFTLSNSSNYSLVENRKSTSSQSNYYSQNSSFYLYYNFYKKYIFKTNTGYAFSGASGNLQSNSRVYINLSLSTKLFKNNSGEIMLTAYDLANNQAEVIRRNDEFSIYESYQPTLNKFYLVTFAYRI